MRKSMRKITISLLLAVLVMLFPAWGSAADLNFNVVIARQGGATCGELWIDNTLVWRLALLADGVKPVVYNGNHANTTLIIPDIVSGMFVIKIE